MRMDIGSNYTVDEGLSALSRDAATVYTAAIDHKNGPCGAFFISCGTFSTSFVSTLQYSDDNSSWTDEPDTTAGNTVSATLTEAGDAQINVPNPRGRYSRVKTVIGGTCVFGITSIIGPKRSV